MSHSDEFENSPLNTRSGADWGELLSAYIDQETSPAERQLVEQRLAESREYRELLQDLQSLSASIRDLPPAPLPDKLRTAVLQQATQQRSAVNPSPVKIRSWRREWWVAGLATAATAIAVLLLPVASRPTGGFQAVDHLVVHAPVATETQLGANVATSPVFSDRDVVADFDLVPARRMARSPAALPSDKAGESERFEKRIEVMDTEEARNSGDVALDAKLETWEDLQPYLSLLSQNPGTVANVDVMVVDVKQAADQFEVLLLKNGIAVMPEEPQAAAASDARAKEASPSHAAAENKANAQSGDGPAPATPGGAKSGDGSSELVAVYVEANGEPITKALAEMVRQRSLVAMKLQPPLQLPGNQRGLAENVQNGDGEQNSSMHLARLTPELRDAYRQNSAAFQEAFEGVSAEDHLENRWPEFENLAAGSMQERGVTEPLAGSSVRNTPGAGPQVAITNNSISRFNVTQTDSTATGLALNFSQRLKLPGPEPYFGTESQPKLPSLAHRNSAAPTPPIQLRSGNKGEAEPYWLTQNAPANGHPASPQAVRVLFVLQQAPAVPPPPK